MVTVVGRKAIGAGRYAARAKKVADGIADVLRSPDDVGTARRANDPKGPASWKDCSVGSGYAGISMLYSGRISEEGDAAKIAGHRYLARASAFLEGGRGVGTLGIFYEVCGLGYSLALAQQATGGGYTRALNALDSEVCAGARHFCDLVEAAPLGPMARYDLIDGLTGIGRYLLMRGCGPDILARVLSAIVDMTALVPHEGRLVPGFWSTTPPSRNPDAHRDLQEFGHLNLGLAHGIAGPLALLAICELRGVSVTGQEAAIRSLMGTFEKFRKEDDYGTFWPNTISLEQWDRGSSPASRSRASWCYGAPGVSRAVALAAASAGNAEWLRTAERSVESILRVPLDDWGVSHWSLCHGWAGAMQALRYFTDGPHGDRVVEVIDALADRALSEIEAEGLPALEMGQEGLAPGVSPAGFLEGAAGLALALDDYAGRQSDFPWDAALMLR
ncbi:lanthionine synthetase C family protein [Streptomyces niveus]|uniref:lanthionine synthetase C family protein n=1 Tax=Streptomyces niveus TaxID=193462 RepID=UPI0036BFEA3C